MAKIEKFFFLFAGIIPMNARIIDIKNIPPEKEFSSLKTNKRSIPVKVITKLTIDAIEIRSGCLTFSVIPYNLD